MSTIIMDNKEELVMRLVHYFITEQNYTPIVVTGVKNEVWLENIDGPYRIIRINSNYIHNKEQYKLDIYKTKSIIKQIRKKTLSFKMPTLNICLDLNEGVSLEDNVKNISSLSAKNINDIEKNELITSVFPDIYNNLLNDSKGIDLIINVTNDINKKTAKENRRYENTFSPKKIIITKILMAICILMFIATTIYPELIYLLANNGKLKGEVWRLITSIFIHGSIWHILCNMYSLMILGNQVESYLGKTKFLAIYLISGILGNLMSNVFTVGYGVGASGAIFGLMGSLLYFGYHYRLYLSSVIKSQLIPIIIINLAIGYITPGIDNWAHIGGLIGGVLSTMIVGIDGKTTKSERINGTIVLCILIAFFIYMSLNK